MVNIYSVHDKRPDFIPYQAKTFSKLLDEEYRFIVCDNALDGKDSAAIKKLAKRYRLGYLLIPGQHHENPNIAASYPLDYLVQEVLAKENSADTSVIIDSDIFLMQRFSFSSFIQNFKMAGVYQERGKLYYLWNALVLFNHRRISSEELMRIFFADSASQNSCYYPAELFNNGRLEGELVDVGGPTYYFIRQPGNEPRYISASRITEFYSNIDLLPREVRTYYMPFYTSEFGAGEKSLVASDMLLDNTFFHYRGGSNWNGLSTKGMELKTAILDKMVELALKGRIPKKANGRIVPD